jgi:hypothetical protein
MGIWWMGLRNAPVSNGYLFLLICPLSEALAYLPSPQPSPHNSIAEARLRGGFVFIPLAIMTTASFPAYRTNRNEAWRVCDVLGVES